MDNYPAEVIKAIATKIAEDMLADTDGISQHVLLEIIEALERGEDVYDGLANTVLTRPCMERLINELIKYEEE